MTISPLVATLHPDDVLLFNEIRSAMFRIATEYRLPLKSVEPLHMPADGMSDRKGECTANGHIRLVMRCTVNGQWCDGPRSPEDIWETAVHELAHLRHFHHGPTHIAFTDELGQALSNLRRKQDHRDKVIDRLHKMARQRDSEMQLGNAEAADAFAQAINRMLIENELRPTDIEYAEVLKSDPIVEVQWNPSQYRVKTTKARVAWQNALARIVARSNLCTYLIRPKSNDIWFVGTKAHATVAEYTFGVLVASAEKMAKQAAGKNYREHFEDRSVERLGFKSAWLAAFVQRIGDRFAEAQRDAVRSVAQESHLPDVDASSQALVRIHNAMTRVQQYVDDKFRGMKIKARAPMLYSSGHAAGAAAGRAAADAMVIGRKGLKA